MSIVHYNTAEAQCFILHDMAKDQPPNAFLGPNVASLRQEHGLSQQRLADEAGLSRATIAAIEGGRFASSDTSTLVRIARVFGIAPENASRLLSPNPKRGPMDPFVDEYEASDIAKEVKASASELAWLRSLPEVVFFGMRPTPYTIARIIGFRRETEQRGA
jgi:putative transcriptional regulator